MQSDGNLVLSDTSSHPLWSSATSGHTSAYLSLLDSGQLTVNTANAPLWSGPGELVPNKTLQPGQTLKSPSGAFRLVMQSDGNLVEYTKSGTAVWSTGTASPGSLLRMQSDGNLVLSDTSSHPLWSSATSGHTSAYLSLLDSGQLTVNTANAPLWSGPGELVPNKTLQPGQTLKSPSGAFRLVMQSDGNLVEYTKSGTAVWSTGTASPGSLLRMQSDGNLVLSDTSSHPLWSSATSGHTSAYLSLLDSGQLTVNTANAPLWSGPGELVPNKTLQPGQTLKSPSGAFRLVMQSDGNLVEYTKSGTAVWSTGTASPGSLLRMQSDGNLVLSDTSSHPLWSSATSGHTSAYLSLLDSGQLTVNTANTPLWTAGNP